MSLGIREISEFAQEKNAVVVELIELHHNCSLETYVTIAGLDHVLLSVFGVFRDHILIAVSTSADLKYNLHHQLGLVRSHA